MSSSDVLKILPKYLSSRFGSIKSYVWESLFPYDYKSKILGRTPKEYRREKYNSMINLADEATLIVFIFILNKFFLEGHTAAKKSVDLLSSLDVDGYYLGKNLYKGRNKNVMMGKNLARKLMLVVGKETRNIIEEANYISDILNLYKQKCKKIYGYISF